jgi:hypothetical protein
VKDPNEQVIPVGTCPASGRRRISPTRAKHRTRGHVGLPQANDACGSGTATELTLVISPELVKQIAERAAQFVAEHQSASALEPLLTVGQLAEMLATTPEWVRRHQAEIGAFRLSDGGGRNPIRFRGSEVERFLAGRRLRPPERVAARGWRDDPDWASS